MQLLAPHGAVDLLGYVALVANLYVYYAKTMIPLRLAAIVASGLFLVFFALVGNPQTALLNGVLLAINIYRLLEIRTLIGRTRDAARGDIDIELLRPVHGETPSRGRGEAVRVGRPGRAGLLPHARRD